METVYRKVWFWILIFIVGLIVIALSLQLNSVNSSKTLPPNNVENTLPQEV